MLSSKFGIEIEFTGISRSEAADVVSKYLEGTVTTTATLCVHCVSVASSSYPHPKVSTILLPVCSYTAL